MIPRECVGEARRSGYRSGVYSFLAGQLLYYMVTLGSDCTNYTRNMVRRVSNPGPDHWNEMDCAVGYLGVRRYIYIR